MSDAEKTPERPRIPLIYVAGPVNSGARDMIGVDQNMLAAVVFGLELAKLGAYPVIPHSNAGHSEFHKMPAPAGFEDAYTFWLDGTEAMMLVCDAVFFMPSWRMSRGAVREHESSLAARMPQLFCLSQAKEFIQRFKAISSVDTDLSLID